MGAAVLPERLPIACASAKISDGRLREREALDQLSDVLTALVRQARASESVYAD